MIKFFSAAREAIHNLFRRPVTVNFPLDHVPVPPAFRGKPVLDPSKCSLCSRCQRVCPTHAITINKETRKSGTLTIDIGKCCYCGECEDTCNFEGIHLTNDWLTSKLDKSQLITTYRIEEEVD